MNVYLVREYWGAYSDAGERISGVFATQRGAEDFIRAQLLPVYKDFDGEVYAWEGWEDSEDVYAIAPEIKPVRLPDFLQVLSEGKYGCHYSLDTSLFQVIEMEVQE